MPPSNDSEGSVIDSSVDSEAVVSIRSLINGVEAFTGAIGARFGLSNSENVAMRELSVVGSLTPGDIAGRTGLTSSSVTNLVDRLERIGHVKRRAHPEDRRSVLIDLTDEGRAALVWTRSLMVHAYDGITPGDLSEVMSAIRTIAASLTAQAEKINQREV
jgi:DNA-binding MarR family transcriptional regulator